MDTSARLALPLLVPGQAQKELFHNEALTLVDLALQAGVAGIGLNAAPASPVIGQCWIVGTAPTGAWSGEARALAGWTAGGWRFVAPIEGMAVWDAVAGQVARYAGGTWVSGDVAATRLVVGGVQVVGAQRPAIPVPAGGDTIDVQARGTLTAILTTLRGHGLIAG